MTSVPVPVPEAAMPDRPTTQVCDRVPSSSLLHQECRIRTAASAQLENASVERVGHHGDDRVHAGPDFLGELDPQTRNGHAALDQHGSLVVDAVKDVPTEDEPRRSIPLVGDGAAAVLDDVLLGFALKLREGFAAVVQQRGDAGGDLPTRCLDLTVSPRSEMLSGTISMLAG